MSYSALLAIPKSMILSGVALDSWKKFYLTPLSPSDISWQIIGYSGQPVTLYRLDGLTATTLVSGYDVYTRGYKIS